MEKFGIDILWASRYSYKKGQTLSKHKHDKYYHIMYFVTGDGHFLYDQQDFAFSSGTLFFIKPGIIHGFKNDSIETFITLDIKFYIVEQDIQSECEDINPCYIDIPIEISSILERIITEGLSKHPLYISYTTTCLLQILYQLVRLQYESYVRPSIINKTESNQISETVASLVEKYLHCHYVHPFTITDIAEHLGYNPSYISKKFRLQYKTTIHDYIMRYRINKAKQIILYSNGTLKQIAEEVGFANIHHFTRVFKKYEGVSPGQWQNKEKNAMQKDIYFE